MSKIKIKFGSDPEFFAGIPVDGGFSAIPPVVFRTTLGVPFTENSNHPIFATYGDTYVHEDGAAFEMATKPSYDWTEMWKTLQDARRAFGIDILSKFPETCQRDLLVLPSIGWDVSRWENAGPEFEMATQFGCDPDQDAYKMKAKCKVMDASQHPYRYGGGHIHFSGCEEFISQPLLGIRSLAMTAGLAGIAYSDVPDLERERIFLYGKPGKFRLQKYPNGESGIEYRTLSNRWTGDYSLAEKVFTWAAIGINNLLVDKLLLEISDLIEAEAIDAIMTVNQEKAKSILSYIENKL